MKNFIIDRVKRVIHNGEKHRFLLTQVTDFQLSMEADTEDATDAIGGVIKTFERAKRAKASGNSKIFTPDLLAAQVGAEETVASSTAKILMPRVDIKTIESNNTITLDKTPKDEISVVSILNDDSNYGINLTLTTGEADAKTFKTTSSGGTTTLTFSAAYAGKRVFVQYWYESEVGSEIEAKGDGVSSEGETIIEVVGTEICGGDTYSVKYLVFPSSKLTYQNDVTFATDMSQPFEISALTDYCGSESGTLWKLIDPSV